MEHQEDLTNEQIKKKFKSQFELVGYAIKLAENMIQTGRGPRVKSDSQNVAIHILDEINSGLDKFEDIPKEVKAESSDGLNGRPYQRDSAQRDSSPRDSGREENKNPERKRTRKILMD